MKKLTKEEWYSQMTSNAKSALDYISNGCPDSIVKYFEEHRDNIIWAITSDDTLDICFKEIPPKLKAYLEIKDKEGHSDEVEDMEDEAELMSDETDWFEIPGGHIVVSFWFD